VSQASGPRTDVLVIPDGAGPALLEAARTPVLEALTAEGQHARILSTPPGLPPGSETCIPTLLGRPPQRPVGRGRVDAAGYDVAVPAGLTPWRVDVLRPDGTRASASEAAVVARGLGVPAVPVRGHRLILLSARRPDSDTRLRVWNDGPAPEGRLDPPTAIVCGPGAAAGCGRLLGAHVTIPGGATGDVDTDLRAKARAAAAVIAERWPRVVVHVGAPDEAAHRLDRNAAISAIERLDAQLLEPLRELVARAPGRLAVCPDHATDPVTGRHTSDPVTGVTWSPDGEPAPVAAEPVDPAWLFSACGQAVSA